MNIIEYKVERIVTAKMGEQNKHQATLGFNTKIEPVPKELKEDMQNALNAHFVALEQLLNNSKMTINELTYKIGIKEDNHE